jgi:hypothetical protein
VLVFFGFFFLQTSVFSVGVMGGKIVLKVKQEDNETVLMSRVNTYNDGNWHYISIMKDGFV